MEEAITVVPGRVHQGVTQGGGAGNERAVLKAIYEANGGGGKEISRKLDG